jgi:hypothetical protein
LCNRAVYNSEANKALPEAIEPFPQYLDNYPNLPCPYCQHLANIDRDGEIEQNATIRKFRIVRQEGSRQVTREIEHYSLEAILAVGYRVRSKEGVQFRINKLCWEKFG